MDVSASYNVLVTLAAAGNGSFGPPLEESFESGFLERHDAIRLMQRLKLQGFTKGADWVSLPPNASERDLTLTLQRIRTFSEGLEQTDSTLVQERIKLRDQFASLSAEKNMEVRIAAADVLAQVGLATKFRGQIQELGGMGLLGIAGTNGEYVQERLQRSLVAKMKRRAIKEALVDLKEERKRVPLQTKDLTDEERTALAKAMEKKFLSRGEEAAEALTSLAASLEENYPFMAGQLLVEAAHAIRRHRYVDVKVVDLFHRAARLFLDAELPIHAATAFYYGGESMPDNADSDKESATLAADALMLFHDSIVRNREAREKTREIILALRRHAAYRHRGLKRATKLLGVVQEAHGRWLIENEEDRIRLFGARHLFDGALNRLRGGDSLSEAGAVVGIGIQVLYKVGLLEPLPPAPAASEAS